MDIIREVKRLAPHVFLVMHGSSSVPRELVDEVNAYGGKVPGAMGVPIPMIQEGIKMGIRKINIDTDGRLAFTGAIRRYLFENPAVFDQRKYLAAGRTAIQSWVERKMKEFGTAGHAGDYAPATLEEMKKLYSH
jgi:fructose-bisphosphate aldolase class II